MNESRSEFPKTAACACGNLTITAAAPPRFVHACSCTDCQHGSGSAFSYSAFFGEADVATAGAHNIWRRTSDAGRWQDRCFCPTCGTTVFSRLESLPGLVCVAIGCFADLQFQRPGTLYWSSRSHHWLELPANIERVETQ
jgi:hypothetical protein